MGMRIHSATHSERLGEIAKLLEKNDEHDDLFDMTCTAGYDNDGSTGPELVDNGIALGFECLGYSLRAKIFWAIGDNSGIWTTCYYQYGLNEDDAISRLEKRFGSPLPVACEK